MKLPPLPLPDLNNSTGWERTDAQVIAYGKACYLAALEEAAELVLLYWGRSFAETVEGIRALKEKIE